MGVFEQVFHQIAPRQKLRRQIDEVREVGCTALINQGFTTRHCELGHVAIEIGNRTETFSHADKSLGFDQFAFGGDQARQRFIGNGKIGLQIDNDLRG